MARKGNPLKQDTDSSRVFVRQSGWMMLSTTVSSAFAFAVHGVAPWMSMSEYGLFATLLQVFNLMMIPSMSLQAVLAQGTALEIDSDRQKRIAGAASSLLVLSGVLWLVLACVAVWFKDGITLRLKISQPTSFWITLALGLPQLWLPILMGLLQGRQRFGWLGWTTILNGGGRFLAVVVIVVFLGGQAAGAMGGVLLGIAAALAICAWQSRDGWLVRPAFPDWRAWSRRFFPLTLGLGSCQFMLSADIIFVRSRFDADQTGLYSFAGMLGRGLVFLAGPIVAVMFPKIVRSFARSETTKALSHALGSTAALTVAAALILTLSAFAAPSFLEFLTGPHSFLDPGDRLRLSSLKDSLLFVARLVPWFAWSMLPLAFANVFVAYLIARESYSSIARLGIIAASYGVALSFFNDSMMAVINTLGAFNVLFCVAAAFSVRGWVPPRTSVPREPGLS